MTVTMILDFPGVFERQQAITPTVMIAMVPPQDLIHVAPGIELATVPIGAVGEDGEPTWEDAAWQ